LVQYWTIVDEFFPWSSYLGCVTFFFMQMPFCWEGRKAILEHRHDISHLSPAFEIIPLSSSTPPLLFYSSSTSLLEDSVQSSQLPILPPHWSCFLVLCQSLASVNNTQGSIQVIFGTPPPPPSHSFAFHVPGNCRPTTSQGA
jgi:hypothetical protein